MNICLYFNKINYGLRKNLHLFSVELFLFDVKRQLKIEFVNFYFKINLGL